MNTEEEVSTIVLAVGAVLHLHTDWVKTGLFFLVWGGGRLLLQLVRKRGA